MTVRDIRKAEESVSDAREALDEAHSELEAADELLGDDSRGILSKGLKTLLVLTVIGVVVYFLLKSMDR